MNNTLDDNNMIEEWESSRSNAIGMSKNMAAEHHANMIVVDFPRATPRRYCVCDQARFDSEYAGRDWAVMILTVRA